MMDQKTRVRVSKFLSLVLRHKPETIGLTLDEHGWASVTQLIVAANRYGKLRQPLTLADLIEVVETNDKQRFVLGEHNLMIRASQGHSIDVDLQLEPREPPDVLYHGTAARHRSSIFLSGLARMNRQHVHLSAEAKTAFNVGRRHGLPLVLAIDAARMHLDGHQFYLSENKVWLVKSVPRSYIKIHST